MFRCLTSILLIRMLFLLFHFIPYRNLSCPFKPGSNIISCMKPFLIFQAMLKWAERPGGEEEETGPDPCVRLIPLRGVHKLKHKVHWSGMNWSIILSSEQYSCLWGKGVLVVIFINQWVLGGSFCAWILDLFLF